MRDREVQQGTKDGESDVDMMLATIDWQNQALVGSALREYRERRRLTQAQMAEKMGEGYDAETVTQYEAGSVPMEIDTFLAMTKALGISPEAVRPELLWGQKVIRVGYTKLTDKGREAVDQIISILLTEQQSR